MPAVSKPQRIVRILLGAAAFCALSPVAVTTPAQATEAPAAQSTGTARYQAIYNMVDGRDWTGARTAIAALDPADPMRAYLQAELILQKDSPRADLADILDVLARAPTLPQTEQLRRLAIKRGAQILPDSPQVRQLSWTGGSPQRAILAPLKGDATKQALAARVTALIKDDNPASAEAVVETAQTTLDIACLTELRQRVAWSYFITNDTANARRVALTAAQGGDGAFRAPAWWVAGLASWRAQGWSDAATAFGQAASYANDPDLRSAAFFWQARALMADRKPQKVSAILKAAAREEESFYGMLANETLGLQTPRNLVRDHLTSGDRSRLGTIANARIASVLAALGRSLDADEVLRYEASFGAPENYDALVHLASDLSLPRTQLWLAQRSPNGVKARAYMRYPMPQWVPAGGWRVDKALVYAHMLQESRFQANAISPAGARGLMQVMPATALHMASANGETLNTGDLSKPALNMEYGQRYLEKLSGMSATDGLLAKVVAAYNAGPGAVEKWKMEVADQGDPLLFIESVPYYETRAYVNTVLRNYWMYQLSDSGQSTALTALAQGLWSRFPGQRGEVAIRMSATGRSYSAD